MLIENWDVVYWLLVKNFGKSDCVFKALNHETGLWVGCGSMGSAEPFRMSGDSVAHSYEWPIADVEGRGIAGEGHILVDIEHAGGVARIIAYTSGTAADKLCAIIEMASTLLHELTHICLYNYDQDEDFCERSYAAQKTFRWAMVQRFPQACDSDCCSGWCDETKNWSMYQNGAVGAETLEIGCV